MLRALLTLLMLLCLAPLASAKSYLVLDLNKPINQQLIPNSQFFKDNLRTQDFDDISSVSAEQWESFNRKQFRFGLTQGYTWVKTNIRTEGNQSRHIAIKLHHSLDQLQLRITPLEGKTELFRFGVGSKPNQSLISIDKLKSNPRQQHDDVDLKPDHVLYELQPNQTYEFLLRVNSSNPLIGNYEISEYESLVAETNVVESWLYTYLLLASAIILYSLISYFYAGDKAHLFHTGYMLSAVVYLLLDTGFFGVWLGIYDLQLLQKLTISSLSGILVFMLLFIKEMCATSNGYSKRISAIFDAIILVALATLFTSITFSYAVALRIFVFNTAIALMFAGFLLSSAKFRVDEPTNDGPGSSFRSLALATALITSVLLATIFLITRLGFIDITTLTDYILFLVVFIEIFFKSGFLLLNLRSSNIASTKKTLTNNQSDLPNELALEQRLAESNLNRSHTLLQVWVSGLDGLQTTLGIENFNKFLNHFGQEAKHQLEQTIFFYATDSSQTINELYHSELNTFMIVCRPLTRADEETIHHCFDTALSKTIDEYHEQFDYRVSIGGFIFSGSDYNFEKILQRSALALSDGIKNNTPFSYYTDHIGLNAARRNRLINDFYHSLVKGEFFLMWQPQYDTRSDHITGVEVLARWKHHEFGMVGPDEFIPLLEQSHRISDLTQWVINKVFDQLPVLHQSAGKIEASINLSTRDLSNNHLIEMLDEKLITHKHLVPYITMEITESMMIDDYQVVLANVNKLQERGFKVSIDDFGSGYASFAYLQTLPANELKIDRCYTDRYEEPRTSAILESVIELAKSLNMNIVVEGVESSQQIELFTKLGVDRLQGWAMGKPMPLDDLISRAAPA